MLLGDASSTLRRVRRAAVVTDLSSLELSLPHEAARPSPRRVPRRSRARAALRACRPRQWSKNALVLAAPAAAGVLGNATVAVEVIGAIAAFCMLASATYLLNDVRDVEQDRIHWRKR